MCLLWVELCLPERHTVILTPGTCERDFIWKQGLGGWNQVHMRSDRIGVGPKSNDACPCKKTCKDLGHRHREQKPCVMEAEIGGMQPQAKGCCHQKPGERSEQILPGLQEESTLPHLDLRLLASGPLLLLSPQARGLQPHPSLLILLICLCRACLAKRVFYHDMASQMEQWQRIRLPTQET